MHSFKVDQEISLDFKLNKWVYSEENNSSKWAVRCK